MRPGALRLLVLPAVAVVIAVAAVQAVRSTEPSQFGDSPPTTAVSPSSGPPSTASPTSPAPPPTSPAPSASPAPSTPPPTSPAPTAPAPPPTASPSGASQLPMGGRRIFPEHLLVAYYGTAGTGSLGVLGEDTPERITRRLRRAAAPYAASGRRVQIVYELIVTVADARPGPDGDFSHDIARRDVERHVEAARRNGALLVLDIQPGRTDFLTAARRWEWALREPWVGLALDPEWRMPPGEVPGRTIGRVDAAEINRVSAWLAGLVAERRLPQKVLVVHQFQTGMVGRIRAVRSRPQLAMVQHVDGFGGRADKLATYRRVVRPDRFEIGFKLFLDEDVDMFRPAEVLRLRPRVSFVSYQ